MPPSQKLHIFLCNLYFPSLSLTPSHFLQSTEQVAAFCRSLHEMNPSECVSSSPSPDSPFPPPATLRQLSDADKLRKVVCELVETERTYVKVSVAPRLASAVRPDGLRQSRPGFCQPLNNTYIPRD